MGPAESHHVHPSSSRSEQIAQFLVIVVLLLTPAIVIIYAATMSESDFWWHLRAGQWILQHRVFPRTDPFSSSTLGHPWQAYSWLFEMLIVRLHARFGLGSMLVYTAAMSAVTATAIFYLLRRCQRDFTIAVALTAVNLYCMTGLYTPRPWHFTVLCFTLTLTLVQQARHTGRTLILLWLFPIFILWANTHIQFIDALLLLLLVLGESVISLRLRLGDAHDRFPVTRLKPLPVAGIFIGCMLAVCVNPYGAGIYRTAYDLAAQAGAFNKVAELAAIPFRHAQDFCLLLLVLVAAGVLGRRRTLPLFETSLLALSAVLAFRSQRDIWILAVVATMVVAMGVPGSKGAPYRLPRFATLPALVLVLLSLPLAMRIFHRDNVTLAAKLEETMPVKATQFARQHSVRGPVFTTYEWGGYCMQALDLPATMDGRAALHGDEQLDRSQHTWSGAPGWSKDPDLQSAGVVIGPVENALTQLLRQDPHYTLAYEDKLTAVFVPRP